MGSWARGMVVLGFVAAGVGASAWAQIPAVVTRAVDDGRRVELKDSAGVVFRPVHYDPNAPKPAQSTIPPPVPVKVVGMPGMGGKGISGSSLYVPVAEVLAHPETSELKPADKNHVVEMWVRFAIPAATLNEACVSRARNPQFMVALNPNGEDMDKVMEWLTASGFTNVMPEKMDIIYKTISFRGTVEVIERAFRTQVYSYVANDASVLTPLVPDTTYYTNGTNLSIPEALSPVIDKVFGLSPTGYGGICNGIKAVP